MPFLFGDTCLLARVGDAPHAAGAVVGDVEVSIAADGDTDRTAPHLTVFGHESSEEVFVAALGLTVVHGDADDLIACTLRAVP